MAEIAITGANGRLGKALRACPVWSAEHELTSVLRKSEVDSTSITFDRLCRPEVAARFHAILHLAWGAVPRTATPEQSAADCNLLQELLQSVSKCEVSPQVIFVSTGAVYGEAQLKSGSVETDLPDPRGEYASGKLAAERLLLDHAVSNGIDATVLRVSNVYGIEGVAGPPQGVIPFLFRCARENLEFQQWGVDTEKDYLHIDDLSKAILEAVEHRLTGIFNVASGRSNRLSDLIAMVERITERSISVRKMEGGIEWDVQRNSINPFKFRTAANWKPQVDLESGLIRIANSS